MKKYQKIETEFSKDIAIVLAAYILSGIVNPVYIGLKHIIADLFFN